jgi:chromate transport protein ChrA
MRLTRASPEVTSFTAKLNQRSPFWIHHEEESMTTTTRPSLNLRPVLWAAPLAGVLGAIVNLLIWWILQGDFATIKVGPPGQEMPFWPGAVPLFSIVAALAAGVVYALIARFTRSANSLFLWVGIAVLLLSFASPLTIKNPPASVIIGLEAMHVVVFAFVMRLVPQRPKI